MVLVGDFSPGKSSFILPDVCSKEVVLANLEGPICDKDTQASSKVGALLNIYPPPRLSGRWCFSLANNHIMDYADEGLRQTILFLESCGFIYAGAGRNIEESRHPMIIEENGIRVAIFSCCERQFGVAEEGRSGVAELGTWLLGAISEIKRSGVVDYVVISCHAACEYSPWASPSLRSYYHALIDAGADVIHGHHSHVPQGYEVYRGRPIFYGLGNFLINTEGWKGKRNCIWSISVRVQFLAENLNWELMPCQIKNEKGVMQVVPMSGEDLKRALEYIEIANKAYIDDRHCLSYWQEMSVRMYHKYYSSNMRIVANYKRKLNIRERLLLLYFAVIDIFQSIWGRTITTEKRCYYTKVAYNFLCCQSHVDLMRNALAVLTGAATDLRNEATANDAKKLGMY